MITHTYVTLPLSKVAYDEVANKLTAAGYDHAFIKKGDGRIVIDMHGIAVEVEEEPDTETERFLSALVQSGVRR